MKAIPNPNLTGDWDSATHTASGWKTYRFKDQPQAITLLRCAPREASARRRAGRDARPIVEEFARDL